MAEQTRVGAIITDWIQRQRVSVAHVVKHGRLARSAVYYVMDGTTKNPEIATLRKIARGIASEQTCALILTR